MNNRRSKQKLVTANPFKGNAGLVVRKLISMPNKKWSGRELARELNISQAWVNRVLDSLVADRFVQRYNKGTDSYTEVIDVNKILKKWIQLYNITMNQIHFYIKLKGDPLKLLHKLGPELGFQYAVTGYVAANYIKETTFNAPPMVYLYALKKSQISFNEILMKLENIHNYISVLKKANLIILQPFQKEGVFIESKRIKGVNCVSPLQLYLDLHGLDRGSFVIEELNDHWQENGLFYEV